MPKNTTITMADMQAHMPAVKGNDLLRNRIKQALLVTPDKEFPESCTHRPHGTVDRVLANWPMNMSKPKHETVRRVLGQFIKATWENYAAAYAEAKAA